MRVTYENAIRSSRSKRPLQHAIGMIAVLLSLPCIAQQQPIKVGVLPYADATGGGDANIGGSLSQLTQAQILHMTQMDSKVLAVSGSESEQLDKEKIASLGRQDNVDLIVKAVLLEARCSESAQSATPRSILGQAIGAGLHSYQATVTVQVDIYETSTGKKLDSFRVSQSQTDRKLSGSVSSSLGSADLSNPSFQNSTLGKAMQKTIAELVRHIDSVKGNVSKSNGSSL